MILPTKRLRRSDFDETISSKQCRRNDFDETIYTKLFWRNLLTNFFDDIFTKRYSAKRDSLGKKVWGCPSTSAAIINTAVIKKTCCLKAKYNNNKILSSLKVLTFLTVLPCKTSLARATLGLVQRRVKNMRTVHHQKVVKDQGKRF